LKVKFRNSQIITGVPFSANQEAGISRQKTSPAKQGQRKLKKKLKIIKNKSFFYLSF